MRTGENTTPNAIFVDDGGPDAFEFSSNYIGFNSRDLNDYARAWDEATELWASRQEKLQHLAPDLRLRPPELRSVELELLIPWQELSAQ